MEPREFIRDRFNSKGSKPEEAITIAGLLRINERELYSTSDRYLFELIQNADDKPQPGKAVQIQLYLTENFLIFLHNGMQFSEEDVKAICDAAQSNKATDAKMTGYKGIGFKSVFTDAKTVYIRSGVYSFKFDSHDQIYKDFRTLYKDEISGMTLEKQQKFLEKYEGDEKFLRIENIPWQIKPIWIEAENLPSEIREFSINEKHQVAISMYVSRSILDAKHYRETISQVLAEPRLLLFLRNVESIAFFEKKSGITLEIGMHKNSVSGMRTIQFHDKEQSYIAKSFDIPINNEAFVASGVNIRMILKNNDRVFQSVDEVEIKEIPEKLTSLEQTTLTFCGQIQNNHLTTDRRSVLFNYLPTEDSRFGFPFLANGDFITISNRETIQHENVWNHYIFYHIGYYSIKWLAQLMDNFSDSYLNMLSFAREAKDRHDLKEILEAYKRGFEKAIDEVPFIWDQDGNKCRIGEVIFDPWIIHDVIPIQILEAANCPGPFLHRDLTNGMRADFTKLIGNKGKELNNEDYRVILASAPVQDWMKDVQMNLIVLEWLKRTRKLNNLTDITLFLDQTGILRKSNELYLELDKDLWGWLNVPVLHQDLYGIMHDVDAGFINYDHATFVLKEIIGKKDKVKAIVRDMTMSLAYYRALSHVHKNLPDQPHFQPNGLKAIPIFLESGELDSWNNESFLINSLPLCELIREKALPDGLFKQIHNNYDGLGDEGKKNYSLWTRLGAQSVTPGRILLEKLARLHKDLHQHFEQIQSKEVKLLANRKFWLFVMECVGRVSNDDIQALQLKLHQFPVLTGEELIVISIHAAYLDEAYIQGSITSEVISLLSDPKIRVVSPLYAQDNTKEEIGRWRSIFDKCGVQKDFRNLISFVLKKVNDGNITYSIPIIKFLYKYRKDIPFGSLRRNQLMIQVISGDLKAVSDVLIISYDQKDNYLKVLPSFHIHGLIDKSMIFNEQPELIEFYQNLGCRPINDIDTLIELKFNYLVEKTKAGVSVQESIVMIQEILDCKYFDHILERHHDVLNRMPMLIEGSEAIPVFSPFGQLYLGEAYDENSQNLTLVKESDIRLPFVSRIYLEKISDTNKLKKLFRKICHKAFLEIRIIEEMPRVNLSTDYIAYIDSISEKISKNADNYSDQHYIKNYPELNLINSLDNAYILQIFWKMVKDDEIFRNRVFGKVKYICSLNKYQHDISSIIVFRLKNIACIQCKSGEFSKPSDCYLPEFDNLYQPNYIASLDVLSVKVDNLSIAEILGVRTELRIRDLLILVSSIKDFHKLKQLGIWKKMRLLINSDVNKDVLDKEAVNAFKIHGFLPDQTENFVEVSKLYMVSDAVQIGLGKSSNILHQELNSIGKYFIIKELTLDAFEFNPIEAKQEQEFENRIFDRLPWIAGVCNPQEWETLNQNLESRFKEFEFRSVRSMYFKCQNPEIEGAQLQWYPDSNCCYYKGRWSGQKAAELSKWLYKDCWDIPSFEGPNGIMEHTIFQDFLLDDLQDIMGYIKDNSLEIPESLRGRFEDVVVHEEAEYIKGNVLESSINTDGADKTVDVTAHQRRPPGSVNSNGVFITNGESGDHIWNAPNSIFNESEANEFSQLIGEEVLTEREMNDTNLLALYKALRHFRKLDGYETMSAENELGKTYSQYYLKGITVQDYGSLNVLCRSAQQGLLYITSNIERLLRQPDYWLFVSTGRYNDSYEIIKDIDQLHLKAGDQYDFRVQPIEGKKVVERILNPDDKSYTEPVWIIHIPE